MQLPQSVFSTTVVEAPHPPVSAAMASSLGNLTTYNEVVAKLNRLFDDQLCDVEHLTDVRFIQYMYGCNLTAAFSV